MMNGVMSFRLTFFSENKRIDDNKNKKTNIKPELEEEQKTDRTEIIIKTKSKTDFLHLKKATTLVLRTWKSRHKHIDKIRITYALQ